MEDVIETLSRLDVFDSAISKLQRDLETTILHPRFSHAASHPASNLKVIGNTIQAVGNRPDMDPSSALKDASLVVEYLSQCLPKSSSASIAKPLVESLMTRVVEGCLEPAIPLSIDEFQDYEARLDHVRNLKEAITEQGWSDCSRLVEFLNGIARAWLANRKAACLVAVRNICLGEAQHRKVVERVEKETLSRSDVIVAADHMQADWDAEWSDEDVKDSVAKPSAGAEAERQENGDVSNSEDLSTPVPSSEPTTGQAGNDGNTEAWDWEDDDTAGDASTRAQTSESTENPKTPKTNGKSAKPQKSQRELTLREQYTVTGVPDAILELMKEIISDAESLGTERCV